MRKPISKQAAAVSFRSLFEESDKGCVIIIGSILQETLTQLHEAHIAANTHPSERHLSLVRASQPKEGEVFKELARPHAPLSSFAGVIQIAYAYGLLSYEDFRDLEIIRRLRNEAAHCIWDFSLQDSGVQATVMQLNAEARVERADPQIEKNPPDKKHALNLPQLTAAKRHLILNGLALHDIIQGKLADAIERYLNKRKSHRK